jgi:transglutaminase superfamily protein
MPISSDSPNARNACATEILDINHAGIQKVTEKLRRSRGCGIAFLREAHSHIAKTVRPVYSVNEWQPASKTLENARGSCSQRTAVLEALARAAGIPTRVHAFAVEGSFWYPRFRLTRWFIPKSVLLVWPQFYADNRWIDFDELHAPMEQIAANATSGFTNAGESLFEAVARTPVDFLGKTCGLACAKPEHDLSKFLVNNHGLFDTRDEAFTRLGSFRRTLRGYLFEIVFGGRKSS